MIIKKTSKNGKITTRSCSPNFLADIPKIVYCSISFVKIRPTTIGQLNNKIRSKGAKNQKSNCVQYNVANNIL